MRAKDFIKESPLGMTADDLLQQVADEPSVSKKAKLLSKLRILQKPYFIINRNKPASAQTIQRFKTELEAAEWIKQNGPMFSHGGRAFEIYKGDPAQLDESVITELNVAGEKTNALLYYHSRFKDAKTPTEQNILRAIERELERRGVDQKMKLAADKFTEAKLPCPQATQDLAINTENRDRALKQFNYGPLNVDIPGDYWEKIAEYWKTTVEAAKASNCSNCIAFDISPNMKDCMPGDTFDDDGELGYCWMHHFKCHSARSCHTWAKGGPIKDNDESAEWQGKAFGVNEDLRDWFGTGKKGGAGGGGWDRYNTKGERIGKCGDSKEGEGKPKCLSKSAAAKLRAKGGKKAIAQAVRRKRRKDPNPDRKGKAKNVSNKYTKRK